MINDKRRNECPCADCSLVFGFKEARIPTWMAYQLENEHIKIIGDPYVWKVLLDISNGKEDRGELHRLTTTMMSQNELAAGRFLPDDQLPKAKRGDIFLIPLAAIRSLGHIPEFGTFAGLISMDLEDITKNHIFISHLWENPFEPDPHRNQFRLLQSDTFAETDLIWLDFCCMPQQKLKGDKPMYREYFDYTLGRLNLLLMTMTVKMAVNDWALPDYFHRGWCLFESFFLPNPSVDSLQFQKLTVERGIEFSKRVMKVRFTQDKDAEKVSTLMIENHERIKKANKDASKEPRTASNIEDYHT